MCVHRARETYNNNMSTLPLRIRDFRFEDFETLYQMDQVCFAEGIAFSRGELSFYLTHPRSIARVAEQEGRISGFVLARIKGRSTAHMITLDVEPDGRRRGIGSMLMKDVHRELERRIVAVSILEVGVDNVPAQCLYKKLGYHETATLIGYYRGSEDAYQMELVFMSR